MPSLHLLDFLNDIVAKVRPDGFDYDLARSAVTSGLCPSLVQHLAFKLPLIAGGDYSLENLGLEDAQMHLSVLGQLSKQIQEASTGAPIVGFNEKSTEGK